MQANEVVDIGLARVYDSAITICAKACITYIIATAGCESSSGRCVFLTDIQCHKTGTSLIPCVCLLFLSPLPHPAYTNSTLHV